MATPTNSQSFKKQLLILNQLIKTPQIPKDRVQLINSIKQQQKGFDSIEDQQVTNNNQ